MKHQNKTKNTTNVERVPLSPPNLRRLRHVRTLSLSTYSHSSYIYGVNLPDHPIPIP